MHPTRPHNAVRPEIEAFFERYQDAANKRDVAALASSFTDVFLSLDPTSTNTVTPGAMVAALPARQQLFGRAGVTGTQLQSIIEQPLDETHTLVRTEWALRLASQPPGNSPPTLRSTFLLHQHDGGWRIALYLNHQDLPAVLAKVGAPEDPTRRDQGGRG